MSNVTNDDIESQSKLPVNDISNNLIKMKIIDKTLELVDISGVSYNVKKKN